MRSGDTAFGGMNTDITVIVPVRDMESRIASTIRSAVDVERHLDAADLPHPPVFEILALDERSGDNTLSVLSILHGQIPNLRTLQDIEIGEAIRRAAKVARGNVWLIIDHPVDPELAAWGVSQVLRGHRAAVVPGELLAVDRPVGTRVLVQVHGGLVAAQQAVLRYLRARGEPAAYSPPTDRSARHRARLLVRAGLSRLGLGRFDRPVPSRS